MLYISMLYGLSRETTYVMPFSEHNSDLNDIHLPPACAGSDIGSLHHEAADLNEHNKSLHGVLSGAT